MTDRYNALIVTLESDMRSDDAEAIMNAIRCIKGVVSVSGNVSDLTSHIAYSQARTEIVKKLYSVLHP